MSQEFLVLYNNIIPVSGYSRAILYDLHKESYRFISNDIFELLKTNKALEINIASGLLADGVIELLDNDYLFKCHKDDIELFPALDLSWDHYFDITSVIMEFNFKYLVKVFELNISKSYCIMFASYLQYIENIDNIGKLLINHKIENVEIVILNEIQYNSKNFDYSFFSTNKEVIIKRLILFNSMEYSMSVEHETLFIFLNYSQPSLDKDIYQHIVNRDIFLESMKHNVYYNRKLLIDNDGNIRISFEENIVLGNLDNINSLQKIMKLQNLREYWFISKDDIDICKSCEFRYMCIDSTIPIRRKGGGLLRSQECNYNPFICKWDTEDGYLSLEACGVICNELEFSIDHGRIAEINTVLWADG